MRQVSDAINDALEISARETTILKNALDQFANSHGTAGSQSTTVFQQPSHGSAAAANSSSQRHSGQSNVSKERTPAGSMSPVSQPLGTARKRIRLADASSTVGIRSSSPSSSSPASPSSSPASAPRNIAPRAVAIQNGTGSIRVAPSAQASTTVSDFSIQRVGQPRNITSRAKLLSQARTTAQGSSSSNGGSSSNLQSIDLVGSDGPEHLPTELIPDMFEMSRGIETVREVWDEWTVGLSPSLPSVEQMDKKHGTKWRNSTKERKFYSNRLVIIREIRRLQELTGQSADSVIDTLDKEVKSTSWTRMVSRLRKEHVTRISMLNAADPTTDDEHDAANHSREENKYEY